MKFATISPFIVSLIVLATSLTGCAATQLRPGAERVLVTRQPAPRGCKYIKTVIGEQGGSFTGGLTSNKNLAEGSINDLKNQAYEAGGNYVVLEDSRAGNTISGGPSSISGQQTDVTNTGNAYQCPQEAAGAPADATAANAR